MKNPNRLDEESPDESVPEMDVSRQIQEMIRPGLAALVEQITNQLASKRQMSAIPGKTFGELAETWWALEAKRLVQPGNERRHINHLSEILGMTEPQLTPKVARGALLSLLKPNGPLGPNSINKVHSAARRIIREAQINGEWGASNPFQLVPRLKEVKQEFERISIADARAFLPMLRPDRRRMAMTMLFIGCRPGELIAMRKVDVDLVRKEVTVRRSLSRNQTKNGKIRKIPIPDELVDALTEAVAESPSEYVFCGADGGKMRDDTKLARCLQDAFRKAGLVTGYEYICAGRGCGFREILQAKEPRRCPRDNRRLLIYGVPRPVRFYDLRHSCATMHREAGCDPRVIQLVLGHAASNTTDDIYTHLSNVYLRVELNKLSLYKGTATP